MHTNMSQRIEITEERMKEIHIYLKNKNKFTGLLFSKYYYKSMHLR